MATSATSAADTRAWWARLGTLPVAATVLTAIVALYYLLVAFGNITDYHTNQAFVDHVLAMDTTFGDDDVTWRAIDNNGLVNVAYICVIIWEALTGLVLLWALIEWLRAHLGGQAPGRFEKARRLSMIGFGMGIILFAGGFITIGGEWFQMWQSDTWNGLEPAMRNFVIAGSGLLLVNLPSKDWDH